MVVVRTWGWQVGLVTVAVAALAGCGPGPDEPKPTRMVSVCLTLGPGRAEGDRAKVEFRHDGVVIASGSMDVGAGFEAPVPVEDDVEVYVDGKLVGSSDAGSSSVALGCQEG